MPEEPKPEIGGGGRDGGGRRNRGGRESDPEVVRLAGVTALEVFDELEGGRREEGGGGVGRGGRRGVEEGGKRGGR